VTIAISYIRFSSPEQADGDSLRRQTEETEAWCRRNNARLDDTRTLHDLGASAFRRGKRNAEPDDGMASLPELEEIVNPDRRALTGFLGLIRARNIPRGSYFVIENLDRLSRDDTVPATHLLTSILMSGVKVVQLKPVEQVLTEKSDAFEVMRAVMELSRGNSESRMKSDRIGGNWANWRQQIAQGKKVPPPGPMPPWVRWNGIEFETDPAAGAAIKLIFKWVAEGLGIPKVLARLNGKADGFSPLPPITRIKTDKWKRSTVADLLVDRSVLGELKVKGGTVYESFYPPAVTQEEWLLARRALEARTIGRKGVGRKGKEVSNLFPGLLHDAYDGLTMHLHPYGRHKGKPCVAYVSSGALRGEKGSTFRMLPRGLLENAVLRFVRELKSADLLGGERSRDEEQLAILDGKRADLEGRIAKAKRRVDANPDNAEDVFEFLEKWRGELKEVKQQMEGLAAKLKTDEAECLDDAQRLIDLLRQTPEGERGELRERLRARIREVVQRIDVLLWAVDSTTRAAEIQVTLRGGIVRSIVLAWTCRGRYPGLSIGIGIAVGKPGPNPHLADKRLCEYSSNPAVREWSAWHTETLRPAVQEAIAAEIAVRESLARSDRELGRNRLREFLETETLDGTPPPPRKGGRPRKAPAA
jgi:DNA invertase Pin-like site-specific DNA recombinase